METLSSVNIVIATPVTGAKPATSVNGTGIVSQSVTWSPAVSSTFAAGKQYSATIIVKNATGYEFSSSSILTVTVNGKSVAFAKVSLSKNILTISDYPIGTTANSEISSVSLKLDAPSIGGIPYDCKATAENSAKYDISSVTWYKSSVASGNELSNTTAFAPNTVYAVKIILTAKDGYIFDDDMTNKSVQINSNTLLEDPSFPDGSGKLIMQYAFPMILEGAKPTISLSADPENPEIKSGLDSVTVKFTYKITGDYDAASINFGEGDSDVLITQSGGTIPYTYTSPGTYTVLMRAGNENGTVEKKISVPVTKEKFKASFSATVLSGEAPLSVIFTDTSTGTSGKVIQRSWEFGDGKTESSLTSVPHTFEKEGTYYVKLFISDGTNQDTATKTITVTKKGETAAPAADVEYEPLIILGDVGIPSPLDLIAEFIRLFQEMLNFDNYTFFSGEEE
ncbi:MAG TPA: PKD domain-containing protein [Methanocorpusculum sp.]|nr:PKD domain-containing protein [Methanocorpusculum sp.]